MDCPGATAAPARRAGRRFRTLLTAVDHEYPQVAGTARWLPCREVAARELISANDCCLGRQPARVDPKAILGSPDCLFKSSPSLHPTGGASRPPSSSRTRSRRRCHRDRSAVCAIDPTRARPHRRVKGRARAPSHRQPAPALGQGNAARPGLNRDARVTPRRYLARIRLFFGRCSSSHSPSASISGGT